MSQPRPTSSLAERRRPPSERQSNTAKRLAENPTLMRLHALDVLEQVIAIGKLSVILGEKGLADRVVNLI